MPIYIQVLILRAINLRKNRTTNPIRGVMTPVNGDTELKDQLTLKLDNLSKTLREEALSIPVEARKAETALRPELLKALMTW